jgi:hypothetical protein
MEFNMKEPERPKSGGSYSVTFDTSSIVTAMIWLGSSGISGIIGSASYDALKQVLGKFKSRDKKAQIEEWEALLCARIALFVQCQSLNLPAPELNGLSVQMDQSSDSSWRVSLDNEELSAFVRIPAGDPEKNSAEVIIARYKAIEDLRREIEGPW